MHSELLLGDSRFFVVDEFPGHAWSPESLGGSTVTLHLLGPWLRAGLTYGVIGWMIGQVPLWLLWFAEQPWPDALVVKQLSLELVSSLILGLVVAALARPLAAATGASARMA
jgi:hypothetical protein